MAVESVENAITEPLKAFLLVAFVTAWCLISMPHLVQAEEENGDQKVEVRVVAILSTDELGAKLRYPSSVYCDLGTDETYVVGGGEGKIIVYGPNFFPVVSLAGGRGADAPRGIYIDRTDNLYVCQGKSASRPGRVTMFNPAFFPEREITFAGMPDGENFSPGNLVIGENGNMYISGLNTRGVMVLDRDGRFLHWLKPRDRIVDPKAIADIRAAGSGNRGEQPADVKDSGEDEDTGRTEDGVDLQKLLPSVLLPDEGKTVEPEAARVVGPVKIVDVARDSGGHLYLLSEETSKVYVYGPTEEFLYSFGRKGGSTGKMSRPKSLAIDEKKNAIYIVDYMRHTILIYDLGGRFMYEFGGLGEAPGWFQYPSGLALNRDGRLLVADLFNHRVQVLDVQFSYTFPVFQLSGRQQEGMERPEQLTPAGDEVFQPGPL